MCPKRHCSATENSNEGKKILSLGKLQPKLRLKTQLWLLFFFWEKESEMGRVLISRKSGEKWETREKILRSIAKILNTRPFFCWTEEVVGNCWWWQIREIKKLHSDTSCYYFIIQVQAYMRKQSIIHDFFSVTDSWIYFATLLRQGWMSVILCATKNRIWVNFCAWKEDNGLAINPLLFLFVLLCTYSSFKPYWMKTWDFGLLIRSSKKIHEFSLRGKKNQVNFKRDAKEFRIMSLKGSGIQCILIHDSLTCCRFEEFLQKLLLA